jgi:hypothetical protein
VKIALLIGITSVVWLSAAVAAAGLDGPDHWVASGAAAALCLAPALGTMIAIQTTESRSPVEAIGAVLVAPIVRLAVVVLIGVGLWQTVPAFRDAPLRFWAWVSGFYLFTLVAETALLLSRTGRREPTGV